MGMRFVFVILVFFISCGSKEQKGLVVKVVDGDTFDMKYGNEKIRIRLYGIDAPERGQPFNMKAKEFIAELIAGKEVRVVIRNKDRYGRFVGDVYLRDGKHINAEIVRAGYAWHFRRYSDDPELARLETEAHQAKRGLWQDPKPVAPWDFRRR